MDRVHAGRVFEENNETSREKNNSILQKQTLTRIIDRNNHREFSDFTNFVSDSRSASGSQHLVICYPRPLYGQK